MDVPYTFAEAPAQRPASQLDDNFAALAAAISAFGTVTAYTSNQTITADQTNQTFSNEGAAGAVTLDLPVPDPDAGLAYTFICAAAQTFNLNVSGSVQIAIGEILGTAGAGASCNSPYSSLTLKAVSSTLWVATTNIGSWTNP